MLSISHYILLQDLPSYVVRLQSSNHRRFVRPKMRQKPSTDHLKQLMDRNDITSDISPNLNSKGNSKVDPNAYSTYMGEHYLEHHLTVNCTMYCVVMFYHEPSFFVIIFYYFNGFRVLKVSMCDTILLVVLYIWVVAYCIILIQQSIIDSIYVLDVWMV